MENPKVQITDLRDRLNDRIKEISFKFNEIISFYHLLAYPDKLKAINLIPDFFSLHNELLLKDVILNLYNILDKDSERSIFKLLEWVESNSSKIVSSKDSSLIRDISEFREDFSSKSEKFISLQTIRDKVLAHHDKKFFDGKFKLKEEAPLILLDILKLIELLESIMFDIYFAMEKDISKSDITFHETGTVSSIVDILEQCQEA